MKSPITGKEMFVHTNKQEITISGILVEYTHYAFLCEDSGLTFTTTKIDETNMTNAYNAVEEKRASTKAKATFGFILVLLILGWQIIKCKFSL